MTRPRIIATIAVAALAVLFIATGGFGLWSSDGKPLKLYGNVDIREVDLGFRVGGRVDDMPVDEGMRVKRGEVLARLDVAPLKDALAGAAARLGSAEATLDKLIAGNRAQDIAQAQAVVAARQAAMAKAREDFDRRQALVKTGAISQALFETTRADYLAAQAELKAAEEALSLQRAGTRKEDIAAARAERAVAGADRDRATTDLSDTTLLAPSDGVILTRAREPGAIVQPGETVFTLAIDRPVRVRAYVAEPDLGRVAPGMEVVVNADGIDRDYRGTVGFISPTAEFTPKSVQTEALRTDLVYRLRIIVTDADDRLRQGQPVSVTIRTRPAARR